MRYSKSKDGIERISVQITVRLDRDEVEAIKEELKRKGEPYNDEAVKEYVRSWTHYDPPQETTDEDYGSSIYR